MNQFGPGWDMHPGQLPPPEPRPDDYRTTTPGPYTSPAAPDPFPRKSRPFGAVAVVGAIAGLAILGLWVSASQDQQMVSIPNTVTTTHYTPNVHKPGPPRAQSTDELYLSTVRKQYPEATAIDDKTLLGIASSACQVFRDGGTFRDIADALVTGSDTPDALVFAVGAGVAAYCPEYATRLHP